MTEQQKPTSPDVVWHRPTVTRNQREQLNGHRGVVMWFTGLPSSGKSTIAHSLEQKLHAEACRTFVMDGDNVRHGLSGDLGFTPNDRDENIRRTGEVAKLFLEAGVIVLTAFISPTHAGRTRARALLQPNDFIEIYCRCPVEICEQRDPKGQYQRARAGMLDGFTGVSAPYEEPVNPDLILDTAVLSVDLCVNQVLALLRQRGIISMNGRAA